MIDQVLADFMTTSASGLQTTVTPRPSSQSRSVRWLQSSLRV
jgi:hypothetical protein